MAVNVILRAVVSIFAIGIAMVAFMPAVYDLYYNQSLWDEAPAEAIQVRDNLYATSVVALDVSTGELEGYHQYHWNDSWDWDEVSAPLLIDFQRNGQTVNGMIHPGRNGYLWFCLLYTSPSPRDQTGWPLRG